MPSLTKKIISGKPYYYLRECQRVGGKPKIVWTYYLGSAQTLLEKLTHPRPLRVSIREFGASAAAFDIASALEIAQVIDRHVPKRGAQGPTVGQYLLLAVLNRCVAPRSKAKIGLWYKKTVLRRLFPLVPGQVTSQRFWDNMDRVEEEDIQAIEGELAKRAVDRFGLDLKCLLFDATNFFTFVDSFNDRPSLPQRGHSKEGRDNLRILGLALLVASDGEVPLFHHTYPGNQHDSVTFGDVVMDLARRCQELTQGVCDITLVFDKGNNSEENLKLVDKGPFYFVGSLVPTHHPDLLAIPRRRMKKLDRETLPGVWGYRTRKAVFGVERTILCTFNQALFDSQVKTLNREIGKRKRALTQLESSLKRSQEGVRGKKPTVEGVLKRVNVILSGRHMKALFSVKVKSGRGGLPVLSFRFLEDGWSDLKQTLLGKTILFTNRHDWTEEQIVQAYRGQFHVEASFRLLKDPRFLTFRPTFHWTDQKLKVHAFYCVLALMVLNLLHRKLSQAGLEMSVARMIEKLSDIREVVLLYPGPPGTKQPFVRTVLSEIDKEQQAILEALGLERYLVK